MCVNTIGNVVFRSGHAEAQEQLLDVYERLDDICADVAEMKAAYILHGLGFTPAMQQKKCKDFSGKLGADCHMNV